MEEIIRIHLRSEEDLLETYDNTKISINLINYIIENVSGVDKYKKIKLIINSNKIKLDIRTLIQEGFEREYNKSFMNYETNNMIQLGLFILGFLILIISFVIGENGLLHELLLIIGWVPIWEVVHIELFTDIKENKKRAILKRLMMSEIEIN